MKRLLSKFNLPHVKAADSGDFVMFVNDSGRLPLGSGENNVHEVL